MQYREDKQITAQHKADYVQQLDALLRKRQQLAGEKRSAFIKDIFAEPDRYRQKLREMLGWPLAGYQAAGLPQATMEELSQEDGYTVYRVGFEILDGLVMHGLLFRQAGDEPKPLVLVQHGGSGTPELISGFYGTTTNYNDMLHRVRKFGVHVFAPQLLLWSEQYEIAYDRRALDARLKRVGSSIAAVEIFGLTRILDYFETQSYVNCFGMVGLSYGGFYTLYTTALDTRIQSAISCSYFNTRDEIGWSDWTWHRSAEYFDDAEIACLVYPRRLCIPLGERDALFSVESGKASFERLRNLCRDIGSDWVELITFDGVHEFYKDDAPIARLVKDLYKTIGRK